MGLLIKFINILSSSDFREYIDIIELLHIIEVEPDGLNIVKEGIYVKSSRNRPRYN